MVKGNSLFVALSFLLAVSTSASVSAEQFDYADVFQLQYAASAQVSKDKKSVIYVRRSMDIMSDSMRSSIWQVDLNGKNHRPLLSGKSSYHSPRISPDGTRLAYVSAFDGSSQLYVRWLDTGQTARVTNLQYSPSSIAWSPDGKTIAFSMFTPAPSKSLFTEMPAQPKGANWAGTATYIDDAYYRSDSGGYSPSGFTHIYLVPALGGTPRKISSGDFHHGGSISWSRDQKSIYISANRNDNWQLTPFQADLYAIDVASKEISKVIESEDPEFSPIISPDGKYLAFVTIEDNKKASQNAFLKVMTLSDKKVKSYVKKLDRNIENIQWRDDSQGLYFTFDDHGQKQLGFVALNGELTKMKVLLGGQSLGRPYTSGEYTQVGDGRIVYTAANPNRPADLAVINTKAESTMLTRLNEDLMAHKSMAKVRELTVISSVDKRAIEAWVALPAGFDPEKKYPLILEIHGGPHAAYGPNFSVEVQLMAAKGYVVIWANPRGSTSYGAEFANLIDKKYPSEDYNDLMDVVDGIIEEGYIDENQLFVTGGSGGGTLTAWIIGKTDRFKAAVVAKPVINWMSLALTSDAYIYFAQYWVPGMPWEFPEHLWKHSPLSLVGNVKTPTMLLTGENDYRTPMSETEQYYQALKLMDVDTALVKIKQSGHGIANKPSNLIQKIGNIVAWFEKYQNQPKAVPAR